MFELKFGISHRVTKSLFSWLLSRRITDPDICSSTESTWIDKAKQIPVSVHADCITNSTNLSNDYASLLSALCACLPVKKWHRKQSHSCWVTTFKHLMRFKVMKKQQAGALLSVKCCVKTHHESVMQFWTRPTEEEEQRKKTFDHLVTFWFGSFMLLFCNTRSLAGHENTWRWMVHH